jgi:hypothetical protein
VTNVASGYAFGFGNPMFSESSANFAYPDGYLPALFTSAFGFTTGGSVFSAQIQDDGLGNLYLYTVNPQGTKTILMPNIGIVDYAAGTVAITSLAISSLPSDGSFVFYSRPKNQDVLVTNNQILEINPADINLNVVGE